MTELRNSAHTFLRQRRLAPGKRARRFGGALISRAGSRQRDVLGGREWLATSLSPNTSMRVDCTLDGIIHMATTVS
ncbi:hypothetical protein EYF80_041629 [Liparis tanakae]|uniref:Uncharacterized protein n=1 Tax=Liparis tanakae TaxID=230148 RepID=A0A4Z2G3R3_9TELE|nr:hypothetical protein EYF80_041629 [Liparis tanakae]